MSCSSIDLKAYAIGEGGREKASVENHLRACQPCREELERLNVTRTALLSLPEEDPPRRIAFVSDGIFEPRWWQTIWRSGPAMGFASAALLGAAILVHGFARPAAAPPVALTAEAAKIEQRIQQEVTRQVAARVDVAVANAIRETETQQSEKFAKALDAAEKRYELQRRGDLAALQQTMRYYGQQMGRWMVASNEAGAGRP
jgi:hypothetical protein